MPIADYRMINEVIHMNEIEGKGPTEIAKRLGITKSRASNIIYRYGTFATKKPDPTKLLERRFNFHQDNEEYAL